jgi:F-type H+-transporting ATPase subunit b
MLIDWFTVGAQLLNFLVLVWLLKRFLYHPILDAVDARERGIAAQLAAAEAGKRDAATLRDEFQRRSSEFDAARAALMEEATAAAEAEGLRFAAAAREAAAALLTRHQASLAAEREGLERELAGLVQREVFAIARKTLADLAGATLEAQIVELFAARLRALGIEERRSFAAALTAPGETLTVLSAFELSAEQQAGIAALLTETLGTEGPPRFETAPERVGGIELSAAGQKLGWNIAAYLQALETTLAARLPPPDSSGGAADGR